MTQETRLEIRWLHSYELLTLPKRLRAGMTLTSREYWDEGYELKYDVQVNKCEKGRIELLYERHFLGNTEIPPNDAEWGKSVIHLLKGEAKAWFQGGRAQYCEVCSPSLYDQRERELQFVMTAARLKGQQRLRARLLKDPRAKCAISGATSHTVLQAAHIIDDAFDGVAARQNALLLRADLHLLYDARPKGKSGKKRSSRDYLTIRDDGAVIFSDSLKRNADYKNFKKIDHATQQRVHAALIEAAKRER